MSTRIPVNGLLALFKRMYAERWQYIWGKAEKGCVDCSGAFVWAYKQYGKSIAHGSNSILRMHCGVVTDQAVPGYAAFKVRQDGGEPVRYKTDGIGNAYHIGLVSEDGKHVYNAKGEKYGFCLDGVKGWSCFAPLEAVEYENKVEEVGAMEQVRVTADKVNFRASTRKLADNIICRVNTGDVLELLDDDGAEFWEVRRDGVTGYVAKKYLERVEDTPVTVTDDGTTQWLLTIRDGEIICMTRYYPPANGGGTDGVD